jgi:hypothetical protein
LKGAGTETSIPQNWSSTAAALRNFTRRYANFSRVFASEASYRRRGDVRGHQGVPHHSVAHPGGTRATRWCGHLLAPPTLLWTPSHVGGK